MVAAVDILWVVCLNSVARKLNYACQLYQSKYTVCE